MSNIYLKMNIQPSREQSIALQNIILGKSLVIDAGAGSGKTTFVLLLAYQMPTSKIIQLTYNRHLCDDVRSSKDKYKLHNLAVHTYHSFANVYLDGSIQSDIQMEKALQTRKTFRFLPDFDILVVDEVQDMTILYYLLIKRLLLQRQNQVMKKFQMVIVGDKDQTIYTFKGADNRFLTLGTQIWSSFNLSWVKCTLLETYRCTPSMVSFVNNCLLNSSRLVSAKQNQTHPPVYYYYGNTFKIIDKLTKQLTQMIYKKQVEPTDIFLLTYSPTGKSLKSPLKKLENALSNQGIQIAIPKNDFEHATGNVLKNKVLINSFHQSKGGTKKVVVLMGFDQSIFDFFMKSENDQICHPVLYVAATRASEQLIIVHDESQSPFKFNPIDILNEHQSYIHLDTTCASPTKKKEKENTKVSMEMSVIQLTSFIDLFYSQTQKQIEDMFKQTREVVNDFSVPDTIDISFVRDSIQVIQEDEQLNTEEEEEMIDCVENVSNINGLFFPMKLESVLFPESETSLCTALRQNLTEIKYLLYQINKEDDSHFIQLNFLLEKRPCELYIDEMLFLCTMYDFLRSGYISKLNQVFSFTWIPSDLATHCVSYMVEQLKEGQTKFEVSLNILFEHTMIVGSIDAVQLFNKTVILHEFKYVHNLILEHKFQLLIYAFLNICHFEMNYLSKSNKECSMLSKTHVWSKQSLNYKLYGVLYNFRTGEEWRCDLREEKKKLELIDLVSRCIDFKKSPTLSSLYSDEEFLQRLSNLI